MKNKLLTFLSVFEVKIWAKKEDRPEFWNWYGDPISLWHKVLLGSKEWFTKRTRYSELTITTCDTNVLSDCEVKCEFCHVIQLPGEVFLFPDIWRFTDMREYKGGLLHSFFSHVEEHCRFLSHFLLFWLLVDGNECTSSILIIYNDL